MSSLGSSRNWVYKNWVNPACCFLSAEGRPMSVLCTVPCTYSHSVVWLGPWKEGTWWFLCQVSLKSDVWTWTWKIVGYKNKRRQEEQGSLRNATWKALERRELAKFSRSSVIEANTLIIPWRPEEGAYRVHSNAQRGGRNLTCIVPQGRCTLEKM